MTREELEGMIQEADGLLFAAQGGTVDNDKIEAWRSRLPKPTPDAVEE